MFQQLRNIDSAFKHVRSFSFLLIVGCIALCCYTIYKSYQIVQDTRAKVYILANGKAIEAFSSDRKDNIPRPREDVSLFLLHASSR
jgi:hypothetical protein